MWKTQFFNYKQWNRNISLLFYSFLSLHMEKERNNKMRVFCISAYLKSPQSRLTSGTELNWIQTVNGIVSAVVNSGCQLASGLMAFCRESIQNMSAQQPQYAHGIRRKNHKQKILSGERPATAPNWHLALH